MIVNSSVKKVYLLNSERDSAFFPRCPNKIKKGENKSFEIKVAKK